MSFNCHCERRSPEAISQCKEGLLRFIRKDGKGELKDPAEALG